MSLTAEQSVAIELHERFCKLSHIDQCSWGYEHIGNHPDWKRYAHGDWLRKATALLGRYGDDWREVLETYTTVDKILRG